MQFGDFMNNTDDAGLFSESFCVKGNYALVEEEVRPDVSSGGIYLPDSAGTLDSVFRTGWVLAVGPGRWSESGRFVEPEVVRGDRILYRKYREEARERRGDTTRILLDLREVIAFLAPGIEVVG